MTSKTTTTTTQPTEKPDNRIWIELDRPTDGAFTPAFGKEQCQLANTMLKKLGVTGEFFYSEHDRRYCFGGNTGYRTLTDNGEWFNLDFLGKDVSGEKQFLAYWHKEAFQETRHALIGINECSGDLGYDPQDTAEIDALDIGQVWSSHDYGNRHTITRIR